MAEYTIHFTDLDPIDVAAWNTAEQKEFEVTIEKLDQVPTLSRWSSEGRRVAEVRIEAPGFVLKLRDVYIASLSVDSSGAHCSLRLAADQVEYG